MVGCLHLWSVVAMLVLVGCQGGRGARDETGPTTEAAAHEAAVSEPDILPLDQVKASQSGAVTQTIATTEIVVTYDRPVARGRDLFGGIVAYGQVWNPGANDATMITLSQSITVNGQSLPGGRYSIWAVPDPDQWTVIFSRAVDVFHEPYPGEERDEIRLQVTPHRGDYLETLTFYFPMVEKKDAELRLHWGETIVPLQITVP